MGHRGVRLATKRPREGACGRGENKRGKGGQVTGGEGNDGGGRQAQGDDQWGFERERFSGCAEGSSGPGRLNGGERAAGWADGVGRGLCGGMADGDRDVGGKEEVGGRWETGTGDLLEDGRPEGGRGLGTVGGVVREDDVGYAEGGREAVAGGRGAEVREEGREDL